MKARCRWHFGGGPDYCDSCGHVCDACPYRAHEPLTLEAWQAWDVALKSASQLRVVPGVAIGLDLSACLALANALGYDPAATAEFLPAMELAIIGALNARITTVTNGDNPDDIDGGG